MGAPITFGSLFAGIGGLDLGLQRAGMECRWQVEIDPYCNRILEKHWPEVKRYGDITKIDKTRLEQVDLVCGGFPCQPFSVAGKRKGVEDGRWLWPEFYETVRIVRPRWVLVENVPGLLTIDSGRVFGGILRDLAALGYDAWWGSLRASDVGAPHRRERVFIVANSNGNRVWEQPISERGSGGSSFSGNDCKKRVVAHSNGSRRKWTEVSGELTRKEGPDITGGCGDVADTKNQGIKRRTRFTTDAQSQTGEGRDNGERVHHNGGNPHIPNTTSELPRHGNHGDEPALRNPTKKGGSGCAISTREGWTVEPHLGGVVDGLSPWLDEDWERGVPRVAKGVKGRVDRLRALGNAVVPQVAEFIGRRIMEVKE